MSKNERLRWVLRRLPQAIGVAAGIVAVLLTAYYMLFPGKGYYHADCADTIFWAQASLDAGALYNTDFNYACLLPFGGELLMMPFVAIWGVSFAAHTAGMLLFLVLLTAAMVWFCRTAGFGWGWTGTLVATVLGVLSVSDKLREIFFGHIIYYSLGCLFLMVGLPLLLRSATSAAHRGEQICWLCITGGWCFLCALNGLPSLALFTVPAIVGFYGERFLDVSQRLWSKDHRPSLITAIVAAGGSVAGLVVGKLLSKDIVAGYEDAFSGFSASGEWAKHLDRFLSHWMTLLGADIDGSEKFLSAEGVGGLLRVGVGLLLLVIPFIGLCFWKKLQRPTRVMLLSHATVSGILLFAFVFGSLSNANWRLSPMVFTAAICCVMLAREMWFGGARRIGAVLQSAVAVLAAIGLLAVAKMPADYKQTEGYQGLTAYLQEQGLTYGYATFWNAGVVTVLSDSEVQVRNLEIENGVIKPYTYQSQRKWFADQGDDEQYFLLLTTGEYTDLCAKGNAMLGKATGLLQYENFVILPLDGSLF